MVLKYAGMKPYNLQYHLERILLYWWSSMQMFWDQMSQTCNPFKEKAPFGMVLIYHGLVISPKLIETVEAKPKDVEVSNCDHCKMFFPLARG